VANICDVPEDKRAARAKTRKSAPRMKTRKNVRRVKRIRSEKIAKIKKVTEMT
jgi:hypothetical protein